MQRMFNIFCNEGEPMADSTQVHELFRRVQHPYRKDTVKDLEVRADLDGITYLEAANHLTDAVSNIPEYQLYRNVSVTQASGGNIGGNSGVGGPRKGGRNSGIIYNSQWKVHTGYYQNWKDLVKEYHKTVISTRNKKVFKSIHNAGNKDVSDTKLHISELSSILT